MPLPPAVRATCAYASVSDCVRAPACEWFVPKAIGTGRPMAGLCKVKPAAPAPVLVNVNTATAMDLEGLPGVGRQRAADIVARRPHRDLPDMVARKVIPPGVAGQLAGRVSFR